MLAQSVILRIFHTQYKTHLFINVFAGDRSVLKVEGLEADKEEFGFDRLFIDFYELKVFGFRRDKNYYDNITNKFLLTVSMVIKMKWENWAKYN